MGGFEFLISRLRVLSYLVFPCFFLCSIDQVLELFTMDSMYSYPSQFILLKFSLSLISFFLLNSHSFHLRVNVSGVSMYHLESS